MTSKEILEPYVLDIQRSVTGRSWRWRAKFEQRAHSDALKARLINEFGFESVIAEALSLCLIGRHINQDGLEAFLKPTLKALFPDPSSFMDMDKAVLAILDAIESKANVWVFADYDVDGATSAAQLVRWFRAMGHTLNIYVPDRLKEGYGPSEQAFDRLKTQGADLVITVDCGAMAHKALDYAAQIGLRVVVIDHHLMREDPPSCLAVVNPNRPGCMSQQGNLAAAGVVFVTLAALNREAEARGIFANLAKPDLMQWLDLAALGAICDVTALTGFNRALAAQGLKIMSKLNNPGIKALMEISGGLKEGLNLMGTFQSGFVIGPRINAGGRVGQADLGVRLLSTDDPLEAQDLAKQLDELNSLRREVEAEIIDAANTKAEARLKLEPDLPLLVIAGEGWHAGVIGIVAGRLKERWLKPVIVIGIDPVTQLGKGSGRSVTGINLGAAIGSAYEAGLLFSGGGHAMAAGLSLMAEKIPELERFLLDQIRLQCGDAVITEPMEVDAVLSLGALNRAYYDRLTCLAPFGQGNPEPLWALDNVRLGYVQWMKGGHARLELIDQDGRKAKALCWRAENSPLGDIIKGAAQKYHILTRLKPDDYNGRHGVQLEIEDMAVALEN